MVDVRVEGPAVERGEEILTPEALAFVADLQTRFGAHRDALLAARAARRAEIAAARPDRLPRGHGPCATGDWRVPPPPPGLVDRRVEITGPTEPKMAINALNCGANVWLADLEDANTPHWRNVVGGQVVLHDAVRRTLSFTSPEGREYRLRDGRRPAHDRAPPARLAPARAAPAGRRRARPSARWSTPGSTCSTTRAEQLARGSGPYFYLPKMEGALEARLWALVFDHAEQVLGLPARLDPRHDADRDHPGRLRDGGDAARARRPRHRAQRRPLGLPVQRHQGLPRRRPRASCCPTAARSP